MAGHNDITGDKLISKIGNQAAFDRNFDAIFGKKEKPKCDGCFTCDCKDKSERKENDSRNN